MMENNHADLATRFPELGNPGAVMARISEAFVAPEYARAAFGLVRHLLRSYGTDARFGLSTVITTPHDYSNIIVTLSRWWFLNFHIADADALEGGDDVEEIAPYDYEEVLENGRDTAGDNDDAGDDTVVEGEDVDEDDLDEEEFDEDDMVETTFYQVGTFLLDSTIMPHETIFEREDLDCYAYDFPEDKISAERFYWARMVWEPEDLANEDLVNALRASMEFVIGTYGEDMPFAEHHNSDFAQLIVDEALCERVIAATDFGDVIIIEGTGPEPEPEA